MGNRRRNQREEAQAVLEREAAEIIDGRISGGRPPPEVWQAAAARREAKGLPADSWYRPAETPAPATAERELVLRVVRVPPEAVPSLSPAPGPNAGEGATRVAASTFN